MKTQWQEKLRLGDFEIEPEKRRLTRNGGEPIRLANKPFQVLLYLIENRERVVLRAELLERFWDGHDVYEEALSKCVGTIRKALADQLDSPRFIETRWAEGYRYIGPLETEASQPELPTPEAQQPVAVKVLATEEETRSAQPSTEPETQTLAPSVISSEKAKRARRRLILVCSCLALTIGALFFYWQYQARTKASSTTARSVAVLPLTNLTGDAEQDYFVDGITESLLTKLYQIKDLKVISAGQSRTFKNKETDPKVLGQQLDVEAVLLGSVRFSGELVRVDVRLVNAKDGSVIWSEGYEQFMRDIFALQDDIARRVVTELRGRLSQTDEQTLARRNTENGQAYELYSKGRFFWNKRTEEGLKKSIELFEQAINLDPNYAQAYAGLAQAYSLLNVYSATQTKDAFPKARAAAEKALALDETLVEAHTALALIREQYEWDWPGAEREFKRAIELNPNYATAHQWYSEYLTFVGRTEESLAHIRLAHKLELNSLIINAGLGFPLLHAGRCAEALEHFRKAHEMDANFPMAIYYTARCQVDLKQFDDAIANYQLAVKTSGGSALMLAGLGHAYAVAGRRREAEATLRQLHQLSARRYISPFLIATVYVGLGHNAEALSWLEKAYAERDTLLVLLKIDSRLSPLHADPRFQDLLRRVGL